MIGSPIPLVDLKRQYSSIRDEIDAAVSAVIQSGNYVMGENTMAFEREFAEYLSIKQGIGVGSGTDALTLSLDALGIKSGSEVITTSFTFTSSVDCIVRNGGVPVFVDINSETYTIDTSQIERQITNKTKAILVVHLYGQPADIDPILELANKHGLLVVEDASQAHGAEYKGRKVGGLGVVSCFSFYPSKNLGAVGDAGMIMTSNSELATKLRELREYGQSRKYYHEFIGVNSRLDEVQAAVLRVKLHHLNRWNQQRRKHAELFQELLSQSDGFILPIEAEWSTHIYHLYVIRSRKRESLRQWLKSKRISTGIHYPIPVHMQKSYQSVEYRITSLPVTESHAQEVLSLPLFPEISQDEVKYICDSMIEWQKNA